jgi:hypothetical protein
LFLVVQLLYFDHFQLEYLYLFIFLLWVLLIDFYTYLFLCLIDYFEIELFHVLVLVSFFLLQFLLF